MDKHEIIPGGIRKTIRLIKSNYDQPLELKDVAKEAGMSKFHFSRTFKFYTGKTFKAYLHEVRIEKAKKLLKEKDMNVTRVLFEVGFNDHSYFNKIFRKIVGVTPSIYRKKFDVT